MLVAFDVWREKRKLIALHVRKFPALYLCRVVIAIDGNLRNFLAAKFPNSFIAPVIIGPAGIGDVAVVNDVCDVDRLVDDGDVSRALVDTAAAKKGIDAKIADVDKNIAIRPDITRPVDPCTDADADLARSFRRQRRLAYARARFILPLAPRYP